MGLTWRTPCHGAGTHPRKRKQPRKRITVLDIGSLQLLQQAAQARLQVCGADPGCTASRAAAGAGQSVKDQASQEAKYLAVGA